MKMIRLDNLMSMLLCGFAVTTASPAWIPVPDGFSPATIYDLASEGGRVFAASTEHGTVLKWEPGVATWKKFVTGDTKDYSTDAKLKERDGVLLVLYSHRILRYDAPSDDFLVMDTLKPEPIDYKGDTVFEDAIWEKGKLYSETQFWEHLHGIGDYVDNYSRVWDESSHAKSNSSMPSHGAWGSRFAGWEKLGNDFFAVLDSNLVHGTGPVSALVWDTVKSFHGREDIRLLGSANGRLYLSGASGFYYYAGAGDSLHVLMYPPSPVVKSEERDSILGILTEDGSLFVSRTRGAIWTRIPGPGGKIKSFTLCDRRLYASIDEGSPAQSNLFSLDLSKVEYVDGIFGFRRTKAVPSLTWKAGSWIWNKNLVRPAMGTITLRDSRGRIGWTRVELFQEGVAHVLTLPGLAPGMYLLDISLAGDAYNASLQGAAIFH